MTPAAREAIDAVATELHQCRVEQGGKLLDHEARLRSLEHWQTEWQTRMDLLTGLIRWTLGASALGAVVGVINLVDLILRTRP
jgi:hypothetical protein